MTVLRKALVLGVAAAALIGVAGCSSEGTSAAETSAESTEDAQALPPVFIDPAEVGGTTVEVSVDDAVVVSVDDPEQWSAEVSDPMVAKFTAGGTEDGTTYNPGFQPIDEGETDVVLVAPDGTETTFTLKVTAAK